jgi:hypothetical protein
MEKTTWRRCHKKKDTIKMYLKEVGCDGDWIELVQWWNPVNMAIKF